MRVDEYIDSYCRKYRSVERVISHCRGSYGVRYCKLRVGQKGRFAQCPRSCEVIRFSPIEELAIKRETTLAERFSWLGRVKRT